MPDEEKNEKEDIKELIEDVIKDRFEQLEGKVRSEINEAIAEITEDLQRLWKRNKWVVIGFGTCIVLIVLGGLIF